MCSGRTGRLVGSEKYKVTTQPTARTPAAASRHLRAAHCASGTAPAASANRTAGPAAGSIKVSLLVYDSTTGALLHTWPVPVTQAKNLAVYGRLAAVEGPYRLYLVDLNTGKNVEIGP